MIKENTKIDRAISLFSVSEREQLFRDGVRLNQDQDESNRNVQCLPTLQISGIIKKLCFSAIIVACPIVPKPCFYNNSSS